MPVYIDDLSPSTAALLLAAQAYRAAVDAPRESFVTLESWAFQNPAVRTALVEAIDDWVDDGAPDIGEEP